MKIKQLIEMVDKHAPLNTAESWDNVGLLVGNETSNITGIVTALDCTNEVVEDALNKNCNTIICHHPLIFKGVKQIIEQEGYGAILRKLIKNDMNLIALHTNLDVYPKGVNAMLADKLELKHQSILNPEITTYYKVQVFIPQENLTDFKDKLSEAGLAQEGDYQYCFFESVGQGQFKPVEGANPHIGELNHIAYVDECKLEFMINNNQKHLAQQLIEKYHPYETPVFDFIALEKEADYGLGMIGRLETPLSVDDFVKHVKTKLAMPSVRFSGNISDQIETVAIIGGSGIGFEYDARRKGADIFVTGDIKHHDALDAKIAGINLLDINHYSEYVMREGLASLLSNWLENSEIEFNIYASQINTDPFEYL
ncbi:Nif3-like dinuclear metal center hexameric protein [Staphylococcus caeli]|uniref:GTP cyclohydrolase 1 type 2 homolog n=1 Tax=Staphylococcus caeli TaxID=2201815 RepID=A0A1D4NN97_9STAP|nr:Nif3-like dinuclear metal center hexameric protein [Staphylococcus caeli]SCS23827.1 NIF3 protein [Staphylococcus caeli]SCT12139.1 NIF3 protein [Staphylococcus caeli]